MKNLIPPAVLLLIILVFSGCTNYYGASVQGFVKDAESSGGINGATIYLFDSDPADLAEDAYADSAITSVASVTQNGQDGYFTSRVFWETSMGRFWPDADSGTIYLIVLHEDYQTTFMTHKGVLSDGSNTIPDILMPRARLKAPIIQGQVVNQSGSGTNGVRVLLTQTDVPDNEYAVRTGNNEQGEGGFYRFEEVSWLTEDESKETEFIISVDDETYESSDTVTITVQESTDDDELLPVPGSPIELTRKPVTGFSTSVSGYAYRETSSGDAVPVQGIEVQVSFTKAGGGTAVQKTTTGQNGRFSLTVSWHDSTPGDYGAEDADDTPAPEIPAGEDGLTVTITYTNPGSSELIDPADGIQKTTFSQDFDISSHQDPYYLPDLRVVIP
ncbi:hypothetical protein [Spirochaeta lutea]|uniref:Uncharacterized protein n=1 Tax=Spirochaeta lutea TaxID=1480694 RepID=A0A098QVT1_9SPIO|nr:hypothetical protein [Spirochaeta lutea]KGE71950.1 hypothetical protein DC28_09145 [Spirochaeta lutea]